MALIGQIRNNMWAVFIIIAFALVSFILMDAMGPGGGGGRMSNSVGSIGGKEVTTQEFETAYSTIFSNNQNPNASREALWNYFVEQKLVNGEAEAIGLGIGDDEFQDLQYGTNLSPVIYQYFSNPANGQLNLSELQQIKAQIESGSVTNPEFAARWKEIQRQIIKTRLQSKLTSIVSKSMYTPNWMAQSLYNEENSTVDMAVVKVPFDAIPAGDITVSDTEIMNYAKAHRSDYERDEEKRILEYVEMNVFPSPTDSSTHRNTINELIEEFKSTTNDSLFAISNKGFFNNYYAKAEEVEETYSSNLSEYKVGQVYGPFTVGNSYQAVKLIDKRIVPDSVRASHILARTTAGDLTSVDRANNLIDSLMTVVRRGRVSFDTLAARHSEDLSNSNDGGDLGYFVQGTMVPSFNETTFITGRTGGYYKVTTQFGVHLIHITDQKFLTREPKYKLAFISVPIIPSEDTQNAMYENMVDIVSQYPYLGDLNTAIDGIANLSMQKSNEININDYQIGNLPAGAVSRDIVKWAFDGDITPNDVSPTVYKFQDAQLYYTNKLVIAGLSSVLPDGMPSADELRSKVELTVLNNLKAQQAINGLSSNDLQAVASSYSLEIDTIHNVNMLNSFVSGLGNEPEVLGTAFGQQSGESSQAIIGNSGFFIVKTLGKTEAGDVTNAAYIRNTVSEKARSAVPGSLINSLKKDTKIKDNRSTFY